ncbi:MAG: hypothetical protein K2L31_04500 [Muribaculum sp.]|nr:hypothetical protein [Muribaculum sp.]MDE6457847.1 hypothetical protein [Muribaculum sp.]
MATLYKIFITTVFALSTLVCSGQSFVDKYPKLTKKNLSEFFLDWEAYSDSIASRAVKNDSLIDMVVAYNYLPMQLEGRTCLPGKDVPPKYHVVPQYIEVERYYLDVDTTVFSPRYGFPYYYSELPDNKYRIDSIIPQLPYRGLYLTPNISKALSTFVGGWIKGDKMEKIDKGNLKALKRYIPVDYGHWGGYWWFTSFPLITNICYANNLIAVKIRTSWWTGEETWYIKENGEFVRREEPAGEWIE